MIKKDAKIGIIGAGQVGSVLAKLCNKNNNLAFWVVRNKSKKSELIKKGFNKNKIISCLANIDTHFDIIIIAVKDNQIENLVEEMIKIKKIEFNQKYIFHTSGSITTEVLKNLDTKGAIVGACHPFQTFYDIEKTNLKNIGWGVECDKKEFINFETIIKSFDGNPIYLSKEVVANKPLYHLSAVVASNITLSLLVYAKEVLNKIDLDPIVFLEPIVNQTVQNFFNFINEKSIPLTGPIARSDTDIIQKHLMSLEKYPELKQYYKDLSLFVIKIVQNNKMITKEQAQKLENILTEKGDF